MTDKERNLTDPQGLVERLDLYIGTPSERIDKVACIGFMLFCLALMAVTALLLQAAMRQGQIAVAIVAAVCLVVQTALVGWQVFLLTTHRDIP